MRKSLSLVLSLIFFATPLWAARPVKTLTLGKGLGTGTELYGLIKGAQSATLAFRLPGQLVELEGVVGDKVKKGQRLARLSSEDYQAQASQAAAGVAVAQAQLAQAERELARYQPLHEAGAISDSQFEQVTTGVAMAKAGLANAKAQAARAGYATRDTTLEAPFDGVITLQPVALYSTLAPNQPVVAIESTDRWQVETPLSAADRQRYAPGHKAHVTLEALPGKVFDATLLSLSSRAKQGTQTWMATWELTGTGEGLLPGASARLTPQSLTTTQLAVPPSALFAFEGATALWVVEEGHVKAQPVQVTGFDSQGNALLSNESISAGAVIVVAGVNELSQGEAVTELGRK